MHQRLLAEHVLDRPAQRLPAVNDEQDRLPGIKPPVDQIRQQRASQGGVLGPALPESQRDLDAVGADPECHDVRAVGDVDPIEHHHR